jgi:hypothetical protein
MYVPDSFKVMYHVPEPVPYIEVNCEPNDYGPSYHHILKY